MAMKILVTDSAKTVLSDHFGKVEASGYDCVAKIVYVDSNEEKGIKEGYWTVAYIERESIPITSITNEAGFSFFVESESLPKGAGEIILTSEDGIKISVGFNESSI